MGDFAKGQLTREELTTMMAGGDELTELAEELERPTGS
jgi:simple sugar transport system ATP-binding protein